MGKKHLDRNRHSHLGQEDWWWYEEWGGIDVVVTQRATEAGTVIIRIPWRSIRAALKRKDTPEDADGK